jgi:hypothetical protein
MEIYKIDHLLGVDAEVIDVEEGGALRKRQDDVLAAVHFQVVEASLFVGNLGANVRIL